MVDTSQILLALHKRVEQMYRNVGEFNDNLRMAEDIQNKHNWQDPNFVPPDKDLEEFHFLITENKRMMHQAELLCSLTKEICSLVRYSDYLDEDKSDVFTQLLKQIQESSSPYDLMLTQHREEIGLV